MTPSIEALVARLRPEAAYRVRERACLIYFGSSPAISWADADRQAYEQEAHAQRPLPLAEGFSPKVDELAEVLP